MSHSEHTHHKHENKNHKHVKASEHKSHRNKQKKACLKLKHFSDIESDYLGANRLTNRIGIFNKGKTSNSISRIEKKMSKKVRAQVNQDLKEILQVTKSARHKHHEKHERKYRKNPKDKNVPSSSIMSTYFDCNSGFASTYWEEKVQKSVRVDSVLATVKKQPEKKSPILEELSLAKETLVTQIYPNICRANDILFPCVSNKSKIKNKLIQIKTHLDQSVIPPQQSSTISSGCNSPQLSTSDESKCTSQSIVDDFELNPVFTGEIIYPNFDEMFPPKHNFIELEENSSTSENSVFLSNNAQENENHSFQASMDISNVKKKFVTLIPSSPTSSDNSPSWKLMCSPDVFKPDSVPSPPIYYRHKMF